MLAQLHFALLKEDDFLGPVIKLCTHNLWSITSCFYHFLLWVPREFWDPISNQGANVRLTVSEEFLTMACNWLETIQLLSTIPFCPTQYTTPGPPNGFHWKCFRRGESLPAKGRTTIEEELERVFWEKAEWENRYWEKGVITHLKDNFCFSFLFLFFCKGMDNVLACFFTHLSAFLLPAIAEPNWDNLRRSRRSSSSDSISEYIFLAFPSQNTHSLLGFALSLVCSFWNTVAGAVRRF